MSDFARKLKKEELVRGLDMHTKKRVGPAAHLGGVHRVKRAFDVRQRAPHYDSFYSDDHKLVFSFQKPALHGIDRIDIHKVNSSEFDVEFFQRPTRSQHLTKIAMATVLVDGPRREKNLLEVIEEVTGIEI